MRTLSADNAAILAGVPAVQFRLSVKDSGGTYRDLTTYPGVDLLSELSWGEDLDSNGISWSAGITREMARVSAAPYMEDSPLNRGFNPASAYAPLLAPGRQIKVEYLLQANGDPRAGSWALAFEGYVGSPDSANPDLKLSGAGLEQRLVNCFIERERIYAFAQGAHATGGVYVWTPDTVWVVGDLVCPTDSKQNDHFYRVTTAGTGAPTEPVWPTGGASTVSGGGTVVFTESGATSTSTGTALETVLQQLLDDNLGAGAVTLDVPVSPGWDVQWFLVTRQSLFEEMKALADQQGWLLRYVVSAGASVLRLYDPDRSNTTSAHTFAATDVLEDGCKRLSTDWSAIRNVVRVVYSDSQDLDPGNNPKRKNVSSTDAASITAYQRLFSEIAEASSSNIDTAAEAQDFADRVLSDLSQPEADMETTLRFFFAFVELADLYTFAADGVHFDTDQKLAVVSYSHSVGPEGSNSTIRVRGKPASRGTAGWMRLMTDASGADHHQLTALENVAPIALTVDESPVGGARVQFDWKASKSPRDAQYEVHVSKSSGFTPDASTKVAGPSKDRSFEIGNLDPSQVHYVQIVPIVWNAQKPIRGSASTEVPFTPGRAKTTHLDPNVDWGRLPLNGGFETIFDPAAPPDFWLMNSITGTVWNTNVGLGTGSGVAGANYLKLKTSSSVDDPQVYSSEFSINEFESFAISIWKKCVGGATTNVEWGVQWYDINHAGISIDSHTFAITDNVGTWVKKTATALTPPGGARFARMYVLLYGFGGVGGPSPAKEVHVDDLRFWQL